MLINVVRVGDAMRAFSCAAETFEVGGPDDLVLPIKATPTGRGKNWRRWLFVALAVVGTQSPLSLQAATIEDVIKVPVVLETHFDGHRQAVRQDIVVTVFRDDQRRMSPYLVLNHGRLSSAADRAAYGRVRYSENSRYLVSRGFAVLVPTRIGYGVTGGPDVEYSGPCNKKDYAVGFDAAADQVVAVLARARTLPGVDLSHGIVVGASFGGMTAIKLTTMALPGLAAGVNFSGGVGGDPKRRPENPCSPNQLNQLYRSYGSAAKVPSLWLYSTNDRYWGAQLPHQWFQSFVDAGGNARFVQLPPYGDDGHKSFTDNPPAWKPAVEGFFREFRFGEASKAGSE